MAKTLYSVVQDPGMTDTVIKSDLTDSQAWTLAKRLSEKDKDGHTFDVMRQLPDGSLTSEF